MSDLTMADVAPLLDEIIVAQKSVFAQKYPDLKNEELDVHMAELRSDLAEAVPSLISVANLTVQPRETALNKIRQDILRSINI